MMKNLLLVLICSALALPALAQGYQVGDVAEDFRLKGVSGKMVSMADYEDAKGFIVIFSCNHCPYVKASEDRIIALHEKFAPMGYPVIAINPNDPELQPEDSYKNMQKRAKEKGFEFPYVVDETQHVARTYGATRTPHVFLLEREDNDELVVRYIGAIDDNTRDPEAVEHRFVEEAVAALESGENPSPTNTKAIGCTIKWSEK